MRTRSHFVPLLLGLLIAGWLLAHISSGQSSESGQLHSEVLNQLRPQPRKERDWLPRPADKLFTLESSQEVTLFGSLRLKTGPEGSFCVLDNGDSRVKCFRADGTFVDTYGNGRGQGPGEFASPTDFAVAEGGEVFVADAGNGRILKFGPNHDAQIVLKTGERPYRLSLSHEDNFFMMPPPAKEQLFLYFNQTGEQQLAFGQFLEDQMRKGQILDGWIEASPDGGFVYSATYAGLLAAYGPDGNLRFLAETINRPKLPKIIRNSASSWVDREAFRTTLSLSVSTRGIHVFTYFNSGIQRIGVIDTYSLSDGSYLYSRRLPESGRQVVVNANHLYTVQNTTVSKWRIPDEAS